MSDGIVIIGSGFAARQLVKNIRKQDAQIPLTLIAADSMDEYNKPDLSHVISRGQKADDLNPAKRRRVRRAVHSASVSPYLGKRYRRRKPVSEEPR